MKHQAEKSFDVENVGLIDSAFRASLAIAVLLGVLLVPTISSTELVALTLIAAYAGLTAFIGWDPFYAMMQAPRNSQPEQQAPTTVATTSAPYPVDADMPPHKKAA
jgi:hypothetical protein